MTVTANILDRTFKILVGEHVGTCFTVDVEGRHYLITAKHVAGAIRDNELVDIGIFHDGKWKDVQVKLVGHGDGDVDVTVLAPQVVFSPRYELKLTMHGLSLGEDVYFLGFPYGMMIPDIPDKTTKFLQDFPHPLLKKATTSGFVEDTGTGPMYLDGHNNPGFSGGPVVRKWNGKEQIVVGVISAYRYDRHYVLDEHDKKTSNTYDTNTGIVIAYDVRHVNRIIESNPIGKCIDL